MRTIAIIAVACLSAAACTPTTTGTVAGATTGAIVGGPVGAVVGAGVGATAGAVVGTRVAGPAPGRCFMTGQAGYYILDRNGQPIVVRC